MHELAITHGIVGIAEEAAEGRRVTRVTVAIGRLSGVMADAIAFCFPLVAEGTAVEGATLDVLAIDGRGRCDDCGAEFATESLYAPCPCGSRRVALVAGDELSVKTIELEEVA